MKTILKGLLIVFGLSHSMVNADFLGETDDAYIGFQLTTSVNSNSWSLFSDHNQYSFLLIEQRDGLKNGIALTKDSEGNQILNYLRPSITFDIGGSKISEYAVPVMRLDAEGTSKTNNSTNYAVGGLLVLLAVGAIIKHDLEKPWKPASP